MPSHQPPRLLDQVREAIRLKHFSLKTEKSYVHYVRDFILFHEGGTLKIQGQMRLGCHLSHLAIDHNGAPSTQTKVALRAGRVPINSEEKVPINSEIYN